MITTLYAIGGAIIAVLAAWFAGHGLGKAKGKSEQKAVNDQEKAQAEIVEVKSQQEAKKKSDEITKRIDTEVNSAPAGSSVDWLRKNANRDGDGK